jgi:hypothetical protein
VAEPVPEVVKAKRFELVDSEGKVRAALALHEDGSPGLCLCDEEGRVRATLLLDRHGLPRLSVLSTAGHVNAALAFGAEWKTELVLTDTNEQVIWSAGGQSF